MRNNTVCLCGSTRFIKDFDEANVELTKRGMSVISISMCLPKNEQSNEEEIALKNFLDLVHLNKILRSDCILIVGDGYFGFSTAREILWAHMQERIIVARYKYQSWDDVFNYLTYGYSDIDMVLEARKVLGLRK